MTDIRKRDAIIQIFHVFKQYGAKKALSDLTLDIFKNEFVLVTGPSGAGKTTLLKLLYRGESTSEGQILVDGMNLARIPNKRIPYLRRQFGVIFQDYKLIATKTVFDNVALVLEVQGKGRRLVEKKVNSVLRHVGMEDRRGAYPPSLSGGEQQRIAMARAVVGDPKIVLADEPTGSLDPESAAVIIDLLKRFHLRGGTLVIATHDRDLVAQANGRIIRLQQGQIVDTQPPMETAPHAALL
ncbi:MAG: cell division ATP-binding protein FtsE [Pseudomonadota bacterium]